MTRTVDSYRFVSGATRKLVRNWIGLEEPRAIPWTPCPRPLSQCTVALVSSGAIALATDRPFDQEGERRDPWWGDPSYRIVPQTARSEDIRVHHLHVDPRRAETDLNCLLPVERLAELAERGVVGRPAPRHYSFMGYLLDPTAFLDASVPEIVTHLGNDQVDVVVLVPA